MFPSFHKDLGSFELTQEVNGWHLSFSLVRGEPHATAINYYDGTIWTTPENIADLAKLYPISGWPAFMSPVVEKWRVSNNNPYQEELF